MPTIPKGRHRPYWPTFGILFDPQSMRRKVWFDQSCRYEIGSDQDDTNKLFGWGYISGGHHKDSVRIGWWYNPKNGKMQLNAYCYVTQVVNTKIDGVFKPLPVTSRVIKPMGSVNLEEWVTLEIRKYELYYVFIVNGEEVQRIHTGRHRKQWAYKLGPYFGGNRVSPHRMLIKSKKR